MAENEETEAKSEDRAPAAGGKKKLVLFGGGGLAIVALAFVAATMAMPKQGVEPVEFKGPFVAPLTEGKIQVNLAGSKSFLIVNLNLNYEAVSESYFEGRNLDPVYVAELTDVLVATASSKTREDIEDPVNKPVFLEEIRRAVDPLLFPVHLGDTKSPADVDAASGLGPGLSARLGTFRAPFGERFLHVDAAKKTIRLGDGPDVVWTERDPDLELEDGAGATLFVDVSRVEEDFAGEVPIGVRGRVRRILWNEVLIQ